jgi:transcriptional regulator with XRE-family HTH domain
MKVESFLAKRVHGLRKSCGYTLGELAELSGVSRSMISLIEREETSPTAVVLDKLANALGVTLATLFSNETESKVECNSLARHAEQEIWEDPASGYIRRHVSPGGCSSPLELVEVVFPPGKVVEFKREKRSIVTGQQIWMLEGEMNITVEGTIWSLKAGDCLAMEFHHSIVFANAASFPSRYLVVLASLRSKPRVS